ncbi:Ribosomal RNA small subunit methyltransferase I [Balamuthia mandrillaris]
MLARRCRSTASPLLGRFTPRHSKPLSRLTRLAVTTPFTEQRRGYCQNDFDEKQGAEMEQQEKVEAEALVTERLTQLLEDTDLQDETLQPGLYVIATPIGNLGDVSVRAHHVLRNADVVCCEDTRITLRLLRRFSIVPSLPSPSTNKTKKERDKNKSTPIKASSAATSTRAFGPKLVSYHRHSSPARLQAILTQLARRKVVALVSDSGTPVVSDPGANLVKEAHAEKIPVFAIPGPSAVVSALSVSGFAGDRFVFEGFLPKHRKDKRELLQKLKEQDRTVVFFESPFRIEQTMEYCSEIWGASHEAVIVRELTKRHEEVIRAPFSELVQRVKDKAKGEYTVVIGPIEERKTANKEAHSQYVPN